MTGTFLFQHLQVSLLLILTVTEMKIMYEADTETEIVGENYLFHFIQILMLQVMEQVLPVEVDQIIMWK